MRQNISDIYALLPTVEELDKMPQNKRVEAYERALSLARLLAKANKESQEEICRLQRRLNINSSSSGNPPSLTPIGDNDSPNSRDASGNAEAKDS